MKRLLKQLLAQQPAPPTKAFPAPGGEDRKTDWKSKATEAIARAKAAEAEARQEAKRAEKYRLAAERMEQRTAEFGELNTRLKDLERELAVARDHLMAIEVKLDILEGAANVLDLRTRAAVRPQPSEAGARV